ncbi:MULTISPECIES: ABC transporter permease subunit [unclassified Bradyrhizobium]|uniref:ABC transporter permease subunit n=1 Tax=unclassified Bradyrhizobium TaxID=2631580 RepID=UPI001CD4CF21|nr:MULTISPECIES: ABC transporter permease subunit [unclassified Bradyrhizobium]MCA1386369.1 ABC transporter permease subunit [Bradyrhizobium sp. BRP05]MCA1394472.1 ABC transporter permease subunit [Bradyrhizobium sp. IC3123]MCA1423965.1 ABC transporter permease subunit [Bradyrhizobium sp. BRP23]MCA1431117.1 ABC transporter permease subunit [Bradyrhizobium sp. NBAIM16]MCA1480543.1 ABC transporter permease subunit [Bradyrhizobium sp. NBAIM08]
MLHKLGQITIALTVPAFAILLAVFGIPAVLLFLTSLNAPAFSLANYEAFFSRGANVRVLLQTVEVSVVATSMCVIIGYPMAYLIAAASKGLRTVLLALVVIPYLTSFLVRTYAWIIILGDGGLINNLLLDLGLISSPISLIYNRMAVYIGMVHIMLPVMVLPLVSVMLGIDKSLTAAARSMGAHPFAAFWRVFFPLSLPGVRSGSLLVFVLCLGFYITPAALGGLGDAMLSTFIATQVETSLDLGRIAASAFILLGLAVVMLAIFGLDLSGAQGRAATKRWKSPQQNWLPSFSPSIRYFEELATLYRAKRWAATLYQAVGSKHLWRIIGASFVALVMFYLLFPSLVVIVMSFSAGPSLQFPPAALSLHWYQSFFDNPSWTDAAWTSIQIGIAVALLSTVVGTLAAYGLSRASSTLRSISTMALLTPITIPSIIVGIAAYLGLLKLGLIGTQVGIVLTHSIGATAYVVVIVSATLANFDRRLELAAKSMRANPLQTFTKVTLPLVRPGVIGGALFAFLHSFDEVVKTSLVSGFAIRTLPLKMWENIRHEIDPTIAAIASMLMLLPVAWLIVLYITWWRSRTIVPNALQETTP